MAIGSGALRPGEQLPTMRQLAVELRGDLNTIRHAYDELEETGAIVVLQGEAAHMWRKDRRRSTMARQARKAQALAHQAIALADLGRGGSEQVAQEMLQLIKRARRKAMNTEFSHLSLWPECSRRCDRSALSCAAVGHSLSRSTRQYGVACRLRRSRPSSFLRRLLPLSLLMALQWEKAVVLRFGKLQALRGPGLFLIVPFVDTVAAWMDQRIQTTNSMPSRR